MSPRPVIALLTDFGLRDHYVGVMKGVLATICPDALLIDITHDVAPRDVRAGAFELGASWRYFPAETVFLAVVDPGVGTARAAVGFRTGGCSFVGPDNGLFDLVLAESPPLEAVELTDRRYARPPISATFHGRDRFAPAAAWLARGTPLTAFGAAVALEPRLAWPQPDVHADRVHGEVIHVDRFGNLVTNIHRRLWGESVDIAAVALGSAGSARLVTTYGDARAGELVALFGSTGRLEIAAAEGSAASALDVGRGAAVHVLRRA